MSNRKSGYSPPPINLIHKYNELVHEAIELFGYSFTLSDMRETSKNGYVRRYKHYMEVKKVVAYILSEAFKAHPQEVADMFRVDRSVAYHYIESMTRIMFAPNDNREKNMVYVAKKMLDKYTLSHSYVNTILTDFELGRISKAIAAEQINTYYTNERTTK